MSETRWSDDFFPATPQLVLTRQVGAYRYPGYAGDLAIKSKKQTIANLSTRGQHLPDQWKFFVFAMEASGGFTKEAHVILQRVAKLRSERSGLPYHILMGRMVRRLKFICVRETARLFARALRTYSAAAKFFATGCKAFSKFELALRRISA